MAYKVNTIFTVTYDSFKQGIKGIKSQFKSVEQSAVSARQKVSDAFKNANADIKNVSKSIKDQSNLINSVIKTSALGVATITIPTLLAGKAALTMAGEYEAAEQTLAYTLGEAKKIVDDFVSNNAQKIGMAEKDAYKFANIYSNLLTTVTSDQKSNATYTNKLMQASAVIMNKTGRTFNDVADRIRSGLLGNTEAIEDLGVNVNVALLETTDAFSKIADGRSWEKLSFQEQQQVRILGILEQTTKKYGEEVGDNLSLKLAQTSAALSNAKAEASKFFAIGLQPLLAGLNNATNNIVIFIKYLNTLDDGTKKIITTFVVVIALLPVAALVFSLLIKAINNYIIFTKIASLTTQNLTKSMIGLVGGTLLLVAGIAMLTYGLGLWGKTSNKTAYNTNTAKKAINNLSASQDKNAKSAKKASDANKKLSDNLQSFDEISKLNIDTTGTDSDALNTAIDLSGIDTSAFDNIDNKFDNLNEKVEQFKHKAEELRPVLAALGGILTLSSLFSIAQGIGSVAKTLGLVKGATAATTVATETATASTALATTTTATLGATLSTIATVALGIVAPLAATAWGVHELNKPIGDLSVNTQLLGDNISEATKNAIEPFMSSMQNLGKTIWGLELGKVVTKEDVESVKTQTAELSNTLKTGIIDKYSEMEEQIKNTELFPDASKREQYLSMLEHSMNEEQLMVQFYEDKINGIVQNAAEQNRSLTEIERVQIENIRKQMSEKGIQTLSANQEEALAIKAKFNENFYNLETQQVVDAISQAKELKDKTIKEAQEQYDERIALAEKMKATVPGFTKEMYEEMTEAAKNEYSKQIENAEATYNSIWEKAEEKYPEITKIVDKETGKMKDGWQIAADNIKDKTDKMSSAIKNKIEDIKKKWDEFKAMFNFPKIKTPHFSWSSTPATGWMKTVLEALNIPASIPKLSVSWYKKGGVFGNDSIIGVGEYVGAKSNPEIVAPQSMIYDANIKAIQDSKTNNNNVTSNSGTVTKKIQLELDLKSGGVKLGKQIVDLILDADDFYELGLL